MRSGGPLVVSFRLIPLLAMVVVVWESGQREGV